MSRAVAPELVEPVVRGLVGVMDVDGGPADEQLRVLRAITTHLWERPDLDPSMLEGLSPADVAAAVTDAGARRRFAEVMFTLEMCGHPLTDAQVARAERYSDALGSSPSEVEMLRTAIDEGVARAMADFNRYFDSFAADRTEPSYRDRVVSTPGPDPELVARVEAMRDLPEGTLGHTFTEFYRRNGFALPGTEVTTNTYLYLDHDMIHVITGIAPTGPGEIALGGFQMAMDDNPVNTFAFFAPLIVHEAGLGAIDDIVETTHTLARPGAADLLGAEMARGARTTGDFAFIDHLALVDRPLAEVRARFGVEPPADPDDGHHMFW